MRADVGCSSRGFPASGRATARVALVLLLLLLLASVAGCRQQIKDEEAARIGASTTVDTGAGREGGELVVGIDRESDGWTPALIRLPVAGQWVLSSVVEPLVNVGPDGAVVNWLAESVEPTTAGNFTVWTIKVRPGISMHNGERLDAALVKKNLDFQNASGTYISTAMIGFVRDVVVVDELTVEVRLNVALATYPSTLGLQNGYMVAAAQLDAPDQGRSHPIGSGPFEFETWQKGESFSATKNPDYWRKDEQGAPLPHLDRIVFRVLEDASQRASALRNGDIDMMFTATTRDVSQLQDYVTIEDYDLQKLSIGLNTAAPPFDNVHARRALAFATDRRSLADRVSPDIPLGLSTTPYVKGSEFEVDERETGYYPFDPTRAREEIEQYKRDTGAPSLRFSLFGEDDIDSVRVEQLIQEDWRALGIEMDIQSVNSLEFYRTFLTGGFQAALNAGYENPNGIYNIFYFSSSHAKGVGNVGLNFHQLKDPDLDLLLASVGLQADPQKRKDLTRQATRRINDLAVDIWLFNTPFAVIADRRVRGLEPARANHIGELSPKPWLWGNVSLA